MRRTPLLVVIFWSAAALLLLTSCRAQPSVVEPFDPNVNLRQSVCDRQDLFHNRNITLRHALEGLQLNVMLGVDNRFVMTTSGENVSQIPVSGGGLIPELLDELAIRGRFDWRSSYTLLAAPIFIPENTTFLDLIQWSVKRFDLSAAYWDKTADAAASGVTFPEGWYDSTLILVGPEADEDTTLDTWGFLKPFDREVWICIGATLFLSGLVYKALDYFDPDSEQSNIDVNPSETIYSAGLSFMGEINFQPSTSATRIFAFSLAFFCLLVTSAYTANLASFLVLRNTPSIRIETVNDAVRLDFRICVERGTTVELDLSNSFPDSRVVPQQGEKAVYEGVRDGLCDFALVAVSSFEEFSLNKDVNGECKLTRFGQAFKVREGGFATNSDSGTLCTSLVRDVIDLHLVEMRDEGWLKDAWQRHATRIGTIRCDLDAEDEVDEDTIQLTLAGMSGTFLVHIMFTGFAVLFVVFNNVRKSYRPNKREADSSNLATGEPTKSFRRLSQGELDVLGQYEKMALNHKQKTATILGMMQDMQNEMDEMRLLLTTNAEEQSSPTRIEH